MLHGLYHGVFRVRERVSDKLLRVRVRVPHRVLGLRERMPHELFKLWERVRRMRRMWEWLCFTVYGKLWGQLLTRWVRGDLYWLWVRVPISCFKLICCENEYYKRID